MKKQTEKYSEILRLTDKGEDFEVSKLSDLNKGIFFKFPDSSDLYIYRGGNIKQGFLFQKIDFKEDKLIDFMSKRDKAVLINFKL